MPHHVVVASRDITLPEEVQLALAIGPPSRSVVHAALDLTQAVNLARDLSPRVAIVEMDGDANAFKATVQEILAVSPDTIIAAAYHPDRFDSSDPSSGNHFVQGIRAGASDFLRRPISSSELRQLFDRLEAPSRGRAATNGVIAAFISNKGGVGKTTLAVNAAARLAQRHPGEVLLIDASLQMGLCAPMLDLTPATTLVETMRERERLDPTLIRQLAVPHSCGLDLLAAPPDAVSAGDVDDQLLTRVLNLSRRTYRYVIVDTFPMFDRIVMSVVDAADLAVVVLDNVVPTVLSIAHLLKLLDELGHPEARRRVAVNRMTRVPGNPSQADIEATLHRRVDFTFPYDRRALTAANLGRPFGLSQYRWSGLERGLKSLVADIEMLTRDRVTINGANGKAAVAAPLSTQRRDESESAETLIEPGRKGESDGK